MKAAVMGYGTIGSGVVEVLNINHDSIAKRAGEAIEVKYVLDLRDFPGDPIQDKIVHGTDKSICRFYTAHCLNYHAKEKNVNFLFEASVGGGIPIIRPLNS